jgi:hypothetical protein
LTVQQLSPGAAKKTVSPTSKFLSVAGVIQVVDAEADPLRESEKTLTSILSFPSMVYLSIEI